MIRMIYRDQDGQIQTDLDDNGLARVAEEQTGFLWLDITDHPKDEVRHLLREVFDLDQFSVDNALEEHHMPKVDDWSTYLYVGLHEVTLETDSNQELKTHEIDVFIGPHYLISHQQHSTEVMDNLWAAFQEDHEFLQRGSTYLLYRLTDELADSYMELIEELEDMVDQVENSVLEGTQGNILSKIIDYKHRLSRLRRIVLPQQEVMNKLARGDDEVLDEDKLNYFRDVQSHFERLADILENLRESMTDAADMHLSVINNRMNEIMKTLTFITVVFSPLSFVVGFFGMNFFKAPETLGAWTQRDIFVPMLVLMVVLSAAMVVWLRHKDWK